MAATNAAITQANNAMNNLTKAANAQVNAEAGKNVTQNLTKMNSGYNAAARGFDGVANKMIRLNMQNIANKFKEAARAAEAASAAKAAQNATAGMNLLRAAMVKNLKNVNQGKPPANAAGLV
jgi:hypothetical protein